MDDTPSIPSIGGSNSAAAVVHSPDSSKLSNATGSNTTITPASEKSNSKGKVELKYFGPYENDEGLDMITWYWNTSTNQSLSRLAVGHISVDASSEEVEIWVKKMAKETSEKFGITYESCIYGQVNAARWLQGFIEYKQNEASRQA